MKTILNGRRAIGVVILCAFIAVSAAGASEPSAGSAAWLDGRWYHDGKPTRILVAPDGRSITIINELGQRSDGYANGSGNLVAGGFATACLPALVWHPTAEISQSEMNGDYGPAAISIATVN
jgi:hypothetical protein